MLSLLQNEQKGGGEEMSVIKRTWYVTICHIKLAPSLQDLLQVLKIPSLGGEGGSHRTLRWAALAAPCRAVRGWKKLNI